MANNNNPSGYIPPAPSAISDPSTTEPAPPTMEKPVYVISRLCQTSVKKYMYDTNDPKFPDDEPRFIDCGEYDAEALPYFRCLCSRTNSLSWNRYFSADCVLKECLGDDNRKLFLTQYQAGCEANGSEPLVDISAAWSPYYKSPGELPSASPATTAQSITSTDQPSTSTHTSTLTQATSATTSKSTSKTPKTKTSTKGASPTLSTMPTSTGPADKQMPICGIPQKCMTAKPQGEALCVAGDLDCICKASNSLEKNTEFDQRCVLDACYGDIGREEFLDSLYYHCKKLDKELVDIPIHWEPYLPANYPKPTAAPTPNNPQNPAATPARPKLNAGSIVGIVIGVLVVLAVVLGLLRLWWNKKREAKKLRKENARLQDVTNPDGISHRINTIISDTSFRSFADGNGSAYNDATLIGSPRSTTALPTSPTSPTNRMPPFKEYGTDEQDYAMSEYKPPGHGRDYSRGHHELPNNQLRESQVMQVQRNAPDDSASEYSVRRFSYDADSVDVRQESEGRALWERAKRAEWEREQEQGRNRGSMR